MALIDPEVCNSADGTDTGEPAGGCIGSDVARFSLCGGGITT
jgi:hypothetical protein